MKLKLPEEARRLSIYTGERDKIEGKPLVEAVVEKARELGLAGATVLRGALGYGANSRMRTSKILMLSQDLPLVVEIIDSAEKIDRLLPWLDEVIREGLVTIEPVTVFFYRHKEGEKD
jgi:PII-like signaling protein